MNVKKLLIAIFISFALCIINVDAKTYANYNVGDVVTLNQGTDTTSEWYVIESSDSSKDTIKLFKSTNVQDSVQFDSKTVGTSSIYENATIKEVVDEYGKSLNLGDNLKSARLISINELNAVGCETWTCKSAPSWTYSSFYWTSDRKEETIYVYRVSIYKDITPVSARDTGIGMRPVIVVSKDAVQGGYANTERTFEGFSSSCTKTPTGKEEFECYLKLDKSIRTMNFNLKIEGLRLFDSYNITNENWNEALTVSDTNGTFEISNVALTKNSNSIDSDTLIKITGKVKDLEEGVLKFKLTNISMYDELGDYQNISEITKEIKVLKTEKTQSLIENPNTGIISITLILVSVIIICGVVYFIIVKKTKNNKDKNEKLKIENK